MISRILVPVAAVALSCAAIAGLHSWAASAAVRAAPPVDAQNIVTLPPIHVHPSAAQLRLLRAASSVPPPAAAGAV